MAPFPRLAAADKPRTGINYPRLLWFVQEGDSPSKPRAASPRPLWPQSFSGENLILLVLVW